MVNFINFLLLVTPIAVIATLLVASELFDKNLPNEISQSSKETSYQTLRGHFEMLKWSPNLPDSNIFDDFDQNFKQGKYKPVLADENVFDDFDTEKARHPWPEQKAEDNVFAETPDNYPFNEKSGGHTWKKWEGSSPMEALDEHNVLDNKEDRDIYEIGEHTLGKPFRPYVPERNVLGDIDDSPHQWGRTAASIPGVPGTGGPDPTAYEAMDMQATAKTKKQTVVPRLRDVWFA